MGYARPFFGPCCRGSGVEHVLGKDGVGGSIPLGSTRLNEIPLQYRPVLSRHFFLAFMQFFSCFHAIKIVIIYILNNYAYLVVKIWILEKHLELLLVMEIHLG